MKIIKTFIIHLLKKAEEYAKVDIIYVVKGGSWLLFGQLIISTTSFILSIAYANLVSPQTLGTYRFILSIIGILSIPTLGGINTSLTRSIANGKYGTIIPSLKTKIKWGILGAIGSIIMSIYYFLNDNSDLSFIFLIVSIFLPFMDSFMLYDSVLQGRKDFRSSTLNFIYSHLISFTLTLSTLLITNNLYALVLVYLSSWTLTRGFFLYSTINKLGTHGELDHSSIPYGKHLSAMGIIGTIANSLDRLLVFHFLGATELAIYSIVIGPPEQIKALLKHVYTLSLPKFSSPDSQTNKKNIWGKTIKFMVLIIILVVGYIVFSPIAFDIFFPQYKNYVFYSQLFSLSLIPLAMLLPYSLLESTGNTRALYKFNTTSSVIEIILLVVCIPTGGLLGVIVARILSRLVNFFLSLFVTYRE